MPTYELCASFNACASDQLRERLAGHVLHCDERTILVFADVDNSHDVGMMQVAGGSRFARKVFACRGIVKASLSVIPPYDSRRLRHSSIESRWSTAVVR